MVLSIDVLYQNEHLFRVGKCSPMILLELFSLPVMKARHFGGIPRPSHVLSISYKLYYKLFAHFSLTY